MSRITMDVEATIELGDVLQEVSGTDVYEAMSTTDRDEFLDNCEVSEILKDYDGSALADDLPSHIKDDLVNNLDVDDLIGALDYQGELDRVLNNMETSDLINELDGRIISEMEQRDRALRNAHALTDGDIEKIAEQRNISTGTDLTLDAVKEFIFAQSKEVKAVLLWDMLNCNEETPVKTTETGLEDTKTDSEGVDTPEDVLKLSNDVKTIDL